MRDICRLVWCALVGLFRSRASLETEILLLRHQLNVLRRRSPKRMAFTDVDRLVFARLYHLAPGVLNALKIVKPETVIYWHRAGFRAYWRRKSGPREGRPQIPCELRRLIRDVSLANPLWGAPRIHGELLKLGIEIGQTTVAKYMAKARRSPSQGWLGAAVLKAEWPEDLSTAFSHSALFFASFNPAKTGAAKAVAITKIAKVKRSRFIFILHL
jgi:hypothetical protein